MNRGPSHLQCPTQWRTSSGPSAASPRSRSITCTRSRSPSAYRNHPPLRHSSAPAHPHSTATRACVIIQLLACHKAHKICPQGLHHPYSRDLPKPAEALRSSGLGPPAQRLHPVAPPRAWGAGGPLIRFGPGHWPACPGSRPRPAAACAAPEGPGPIEAVARPACPNAARALVGHLRRWWPWAGTPVREQPGAQECPLSLLPVHLAFRRYAVGLLFFRCSPSFSLSFFLIAPQYRLLEDPLSAPFSGSTQPSTSGLAPASSDSHPHY